MFLILLSVIFGIFAQQAGDFQCIDDTQFKQFTSATAFVVNSCPPGFCFTRSPPNKNPCVGKANAQRIDGAANAVANPAVVATPAANPVVDPAAAANPVANVANPVANVAAQGAVTAGTKAGDFQCIDDTKFKQFTSATAFVVNSCPPGFCFTRSPPNKNPCVGKANAQRIDGTGAAKRSIKPTRNKHHH